MGTSSSFSSPSTQRWNVFKRALDSPLSVERLRVTLFLAGEEAWRDALNAPELATFANALVGAHATLSNRLAEAERPAAVIADVVGEARTALFEQGYSPALPVAERALRTILLETAQGEVPLADATGSEAAEAWARNRGEPERLLQRYIGELFGQWAAHVMARDTTRLLDPERGRSNAEIRKLSRTLSANVSRLAGEVSAAVSSADIESQWRSLVDAVFAQGRQLESQREP